MKKISDRGVLVFLMKSLIALPQSASFSYHSAPVEVKYVQLCMNVRVRVRTRHQCAVFETN